MDFDDTKTETEVRIMAREQDKIYDTDRLETDHIDLYQIHWPSGTWGTPVAGQSH